MSLTGLDTFDATVHKTNAWLKQVMVNLGVDDRRVAYRGTRAALHALRDRLTVEEIAQLGAQLPMLMRGFYYEGWDPTWVPTKIRQPEAFLARMAQELTADDPDPDVVARAVFTMLQQRVAEGEMEDVLHVIPRDIRELVMSPATPSAATSTPATPAS